MRVSAVAKMMFGWSLRSKFILAVTCLTFCTGQIQRSGSCETTLSPIGSFDEEQYSGVWHEYAKFAPGDDSLTGRCVKATYTSFGALRQFYVMNEQTNYFGVIEYASGEATPAHPLSTDGRYTVTLNNKGFGGTGLTDGDYIVLDTDYCEYSIVYSCEEGFFSDDEYYWILTRDPLPSSGLITQVYSNMVVLGLSLTDLTVTDQSCFQNEEERVCPAVQVEVIGVSEGGETEPEPEP